jgi:hypothetical protein
MYLGRFTLLIISRLLTKKNENTINYNHQICVRGCVCVLESCMHLCAFSQSKLYSQLEEWTTTKGKEKGVTVLSEKQKYIFFSML